MGLPGEAARETLLSRLGAGSVRDKAWASLKQLKRGSKEIIELASEAERLAKRLHPCDEEAAERHAVDAFLSALDRPLAAEVKKLGYNNMEEVVTTARRVERILQERPTSGMDTLIESMNRQIQFLTEDLAKTQDKIAAQPPVATPTAALAVPPSQAVAAAQHPPASLAPPRMAHPAATPLPPPYSSGPSQYFFGDNGAPCFQGQRRRSDRGPLRCFLSDEEGHAAYRCPARTLLQRMLRQEAPEPTREPPREQILARSPQPKVAQIGCMVEATHFGPTYYRRRPCPWVSGHGSLYNLPGVRRMVALPRPIGSLKTIREDRTRGTWQATEHCRENRAFDSPVG